MDPVEISADHSSHLYSIGDLAVFSVKTTGSKSTGQLRYRFTMDGKQVLEEGQLNLVGGIACVRIGLSEPGFLRLEVSDGNENHLSVAAVGFDPQAIAPTSERSSEFETFWAGARSDGNRNPRVLIIGVRPHSPVLHKLYTGFCSSDNASTYLLKKA